MKIIGDTVMSVWKDSLKELVASKLIVPTERNLDTYEVLNAVLTINNPLKDLDELLAYEKNRGHVYNDQSHQQYWEAVRQKLRRFPKSNIAQLDFVADKLTNSPYSRHGYASIWAPTVDTVSPYPLCIIGVYFSIRNNCLNMTSILRSNDAWGQALNDMYELIMIQKDMATRLQVKVGSYSHFAMSYHLYTKDRIDALLFLEEKS